jgi:hypothetical protein
MKVPIKSIATAAASVKKAESSYKIIDRVADFEKTQASRPDFDHFKKIEVTKHPNPGWTYGEGVQTHDASLNHREINPYDSNRPMVDNYRLLVSGIAPRPVGFVSTISGDGKSKNLSPFSYFQVIDHDPPMFIVGFSSRPGREKRHIPQPQGNRGVCYQFRI